MESRFTILTLGVEDLEKSYKFYHDGLGLESQGIVGKEFEHGEVAFFIALAQKAGAGITKPAQKTFWGGYGGYFQDPDGHSREILYNPNLVAQD